MKRTRSRDSFIAFLPVMPITTVKLASKPARLIFVLATLFLAAFVAGAPSIGQQQPASGQQQLPRSPGRAKPSKLTSHLIFISIGGLRSDHILSDAYKLRIPNLRALRDKGAYAVGVESIYPSLVFPAHASMATGMLSSDHGITSDQPFDERSGELAQERHWLARAIKTDTIWDAARRAGLITAAISYPATAGAAINLNLPEIAGEGEPQSDSTLARRYLNPPELLDDLFSALQMDLSAILAAPEDLPGAEKQDQIKAAVAAHLFEKHRPHLMLVHFTSFDLAQHRYGPLASEAMAVLERIDELLRRIKDATERTDLIGETTFLVVSGYGFMKIEREFAPNVVLAKKGLLKTDGQGKIIEWRAVAQALGGAAAIFVKDPQDEKAVSEVEAVFREVYESPHSPIWRIIPRREAARLGADPRAALFLEAAPMYAMSPRLRGATVAKAADRGAHGYLPQRSEMRGALIASGRGIKAGAKVEYARLIDIAPTIARLLGLEIRAARGKVISEVIDQ